ncbi:MAG: hypothetical protein KIT10_03745 [Flavobacteriales bacterium]|nr:hypothetical protein [Flavobacteriales bacterium]
MIRAFWIALFMALPFATMAQCAAHAGQDTIVCNNWMYTPQIVLGGIPAATGGTPPYSYAWSAEHSYTVGSNTYYFTASDFLNDTTLSNPTLVDPFDEIYYKLTVTDALGAQCQDSVFVRMANLGTHLGYISATILAGDSFQFFFGSNVSGDYEPFTYVWHPNESLSDSTSLTAWAFPTEYTAYSLTGTDSYGCTATASPLYFINVMPVSVSDVSLPAGGAMVRPVPFVAGGELVLDLPALPGTRFRLIRADGCLARDEPVTGTVHPIPRGDLAVGIYMWSLTSSTGAIGRGRLVVE